MKNFALTFVVAVAMILTACGDTPEAAEAKGKLVGKWQLDQFAVMAGDEMTEEEASIWDAATDAMKDNSFWELTDDGKYEMKIGTEGAMEEESGTWTITDDGKVMVTDEGTMAEDSIVIVELTESIMKVDMTQKGDEEKTILTFKK